MSISRSFAAERAAAFAVHAHGEQLYGHEPYSVHLEAVRAVLHDFSIDGELTIAAWLHDVLEDTTTTREQIAHAFGEDVAALVEAVTGRGPNRKARRADAYAKIEALPDAVFLKLADRIANVEASKPGGRHLVMYREEQPGFEAMIDRAGMTNHPMVKRMLARLRAALGLVAMS
jgi:(p)ppGpp synthase/HD superfamily hydrolase